jgi:hypothetical protein
MDLMTYLDLPAVRDRFLEILAQAESNRPEMGTAADIFRGLVGPATLGETPQEALRT